jgi:hypothetical protein
VSGPRQLERNGGQSGVLASCFHGWILTDPAQRSLPQILSLST